MNYIKVNIFYSSSYISKITHQAIILFAIKVTKVEAKHNQKDLNHAANFAIADGEEFNFDLWAGAVKQQMLAVLRDKNED